MLKYYLYINKENYRFGIKIKENAMLFLVLSIF